MRRLFCHRPLPSLLLLLTVPQYSLRIWKFLDGAIHSAKAHPPLNELDYPVTVHVTFADLVPTCTLFSVFSSSTRSKSTACVATRASATRALFDAHASSCSSALLMVGGLAGSVVCPSSSSLLPYAKVDLHVGLAGAQIHSPRISEPVPVLWLRQRRAERIPDALHSRALDRPEWKRRVRVQYFDFRSGALLGTSVLM